MPKIKASPKVERHLKKSCSVCGRKIKVVLYNNRKYQGGHFFGRIPLYSKKEMDQIVKAKTRPVKIDGFTLNFLTRDPKAERWGEYWEGGRCWRGR